MRYWLAALCAVSVLHTAFVFAEDDPRVQKWASALERDPSFKVRLQAAVLLGRSNDPGARSPLQLALRDENATVRAAACRGLGHLATADIIGPLILIAATDDDAFVRKEALQAIDRVEPNAQVVELIKVSRTSDVEVRRQAMQLITAKNDARARLRMIEAIDDVERVTRIVRDALKKLNVADKAEWLRLGLDSRRETVRMRAIEMLAELGTDKSVQILMDAFEDEMESDDVRRVLRAELRKLKSKLPLAQLEKAATSPVDRYERARALRMLGVIGVDASFPTLTQALHDPDVYIRGVAALALADLGDQRAIAELERLIASEDNARIVQIVRNAVHILGRRNVEVRALRD